MNGVQKIIFIFSQNYKNSGSSSSDFNWGFGDLVKGCFWIASLCEEHQVQFEIMIQNHGFWPSTIKKNNIAKINFEIFRSRDEIFGYIKRGAVDGTCEIATNGLTGWPTSLERQVQIKIKNKINEIFRNANEPQMTNLHDRRVMHFRTNDSFDGGGEKRFSLFIFILIIILLKYIFNCNYFMSNSNRLRGAVDKNKILQTTPGYVHHSGRVMDGITYDSSIDDLYILSTAESILSLSIYPWQSGFVKVVEMVYDRKIIYLNELIWIKWALKIYWKMKKVGGSE